MFLSNLVIYKYFTFIKILFQRMSVIHIFLTLVMASLVAWLINNLFTIQETPV